MAEVVGRRVFLVPARGYAWMMGVSPDGCARLLRLVDSTVRDAIAVSATGKMTLVGHSAAGVLSRLYLSPEPVQGLTGAGCKHASHLVTLGSPHYIRTMHDGHERPWVAERYPSADFAPDLRYTSLAGQYARGQARGSVRERIAYRSYDCLTGVGEDWGGGTVPLSRGTGTSSWMALPNSGGHGTLAHHGMARRHMSRSG